MTPRRILVTSALPYANGPIHLGHLVEYLQTDMWVRFQKLCGHRCVYICADDTHGTAIMISARREGISEEALIARMQKTHLDDFTGFGIEFDNYGSTHSQENREICHRIWASLREADLILTQDVTQLYDPVAGTFLADRFVKGTCPNCKAPDQYGDVCEKCTHTHSPTDLIDPVSTLSGATPELRTSRHLFVDIERLHGFLEQWTQSGDHLQVEIANYLAGHFLSEPLRPWDISRPAPYFGFEIPDSPGDYWYVWFDAPIGYIGSTLAWCRRTGEDFDSWWRSDATEVHHFIGKDISYFHTLFWPAMLKSAGFNLPEKVHIHGFLNVNGEKMSKSRGTFVRAETYLKRLDPSYLRYYYASKLSSRVEDIDMNLDEFAAKVNADLVGNVVNLASRTAKFAAATGLADRYPEDGGLFAQAAADGDAIAEAYESCDYARAMRLIMAAGDRANQFLEKAAPWALAKAAAVDPAKAAAADPASAEGEARAARAAELADVCTIGMNLFRQLAVYLAPVLPRLAEATGRLMNRPIERWDESKTPLVGTGVNRYEHIMVRVRRDEVDAMIEESKVPEETPAASAALAGPAALPAQTPAVPVDDGAALAGEPLVEGVISIDDFTKVDLRVARVVAADDVPEANKLLKLTLSFGGDVRRTVFAGIKSAYRPEQLVGRLVICVANLAPRKMKFGLSEGMVLAAGDKSGIFLLSPDEGAKPGQRVH